MDAIQNNTCELCQKTFTTLSNLQRHKRNVHKQNNETRKREWKCRHCLERFGDYSSLFNHVDETRNYFLKKKSESPTINEAKTEELNDNDKVNEDREKQDSIAEESALQNGLKNRYIYPRHDEKFDLLIFFANIRSKIRDYLHSQLRRLGIKWNVCVQMELERSDGNNI